MRLDARAWKVIKTFPFIILGVALAYLYYPVLIDMEAQWSIDTTYGYGYYIPGVAAYLVWGRRRALSSARRRAWWWGYPVLVAGLLMLLIGQAGGITLASRVSLIIVLLGLAMFLGGPAVTRLLIFPLAFLAIMIPLPAGVLARLTWPLQVFTAQFATTALRAMGFPVLLNGVFIDLPGVKVEVAEACSGFRSLIALGATGVLLAHLTLSHWKSRLLLIGAVVPIAIIANAIRVTWIIVMGTYDQRFFESALHPGSGVIVFVLSTALLISLSVILSRRMPVGRPQPGRVAA